MTGGWWGASTSGDWCLVYRLGEIWDKSKISTTNACWVQTSLTVRIINFQLSSSYNLDQYSFYNCNIFSMLEWEKSHDTHTENASKETIILSMLTQSGQSDLSISNCLAAPIWVKIVECWTWRLQNYGSTWHSRIPGNFAWRVHAGVDQFRPIFIDREAREIMHLVASVRLSVCLSVCLFVCLRALSCLNRLTYDLDFWYGGRPWPRLGWDCRSRS